MNQEDAFISFKASRLRVYSRGLERDTDIPAESRAKFSKFAADQNDADCVYYFSKEFKAILTTAAGDKKMSGAMSAIEAVCDEYAKDVAHYSATSKSPVSPVAAEADTILRVADSDEREGYRRVRAVDARLEEFDKNPDAMKKEVEDLMSKWMRGELGAGPVDAERAMLFNVLTWDDRMRFVFLKMVFDGSTSPVVDHNFLVRTTKPESWKRDHTAVLAHTRLPLMMGKAGQYADPVVLADAAAVMGGRNRLSGGDVPLLGKKVFGPRTGPPLAGGEPLLYVQGPNEHGYYIDAREIADETRRLGNENRMLGQRVSRMQRGNGPIICHACKKPGHIQRNCPNRLTLSGQGAPVGGPPQVVGAAPATEGGSPLFK